MVEEDNAACKRVGHQKAELSVPVSVHPFAKVGKITTKCLKDPIITKDICEEASESCDFTIKQVILVEVPVDFGAITDVGETVVTCFKSSIDDEDKEDEDNDNEDEDNDEDDDDDEQRDYY